MKTCTYPDCDRLTEGTTDFCATHNREIRKAKKDLGFKVDKRKNEEYHKKVKRWKVGKMCALKNEPTKCFGPITCHHKRGRVGQMLLNQKYWLPVCLGHHQYIERHPTEAYNKGWSELRLQKEPHVI